MKKKHIILILIGGVFSFLFIFGTLLGSFDFTRSKRLGKTNYYLVDGTPPGTPYWGLYHKNIETNSFGEGIIDGSVTNVYWNEQYILVTYRYVRYGTNITTIEYYIVKMLPLGVKRGNPCEKTGPLLKEEYEQKKQELLLNEKEMKHINLFDTKHKVLGYVKSFLVIGILLTIIFYVFRGIFKFLKSKVQE
jgi:hypothetical protein